MNSSHCIQFNHVTFESQDPFRTILSDVSFDIPIGKVTCLLGASGSGKSTILRLIAGLETPNSGEIYLRKQLVSKAGYLNVKPEKRALALMFQDYALLPFLNVLDNVLFAITKRIKPEDKAQALQIIKDVGLYHYQSHMPNQLSGGEQQRLALARVIMQNTDIVMLDEPFSHLDSALRRRLRQDTLQILQKHHKTILMVTHDSTEAFLSADYIIYLNSGKVIQTGTPRDIYLNPINLNVALFSGSVNILDCEIKQGYAETALGSFPIKMGYEDGKALLGIRHEGFMLAKDNTTNNNCLIRAKIIHIEFAGSYYRLTLESNFVVFVAELTDHTIGFLNIQDTIELIAREEVRFVFYEKI